VAEFFNSRPGSPSEAPTKGFAERTTVVRAVVLLIFSALSGEGLYLACRLLGSL
jgi:hypothetical protein